MRYSTRASTALIALVSAACLWIVTLPAHSPIFAACGGSDGEYYCYPYKVEDDPGTCPGVTVEDIMFFGDGTAFCGDEPRGCAIHYTIEFSSTCYTTLYTMCASDTCTGVSILPQPTGHTIDDILVCSCGDAMVIHFRPCTATSAHCSGSPADCGGDGECYDLWYFQAHCLNC